MFNTKLKIFNGKPSEIQDRVAAWMKVNQSASIISVNQSECGTGGDWAITYSILYQESDCDTPQSVAKKMTLVTNIINRALLLLLIPAGALVTMLF